jgi:hypothetical protein
LISGLGLALTGGGLVLLLPLDLPARLLALLGWFWWSSRELLTYCRVYARWSACKLSADGEIRLIGDDECCAATLLPGSIVLSEVAWLRLRAENGDVWGELVAGKHRESKDWRRLQVIFRHLNTC